MIGASRGFFYLRLQHDQWEFAARREAYDAAIVSAAHLSPYPEAHNLYGHPPDRLETAVREANRPLLIDPATPGLMSKGVMKYASAGRLRTTPAARAVELPLTLDFLSRESRRNAFVDACLQGQAGARGLGAPYVDLAVGTRERIEISLAMLTRTVLSAGTQTPIGFFQTTLTGMRRQILADIAEQIAATGISHIVVRVRGFGERATGAELDDFLRNQDALLACGLEIVPDCVGRLGPILVREGARAFSAGTMFFRQAQAALLSSGGGGGGVPLPWEHPGGWASVARLDLSDELVSSCPVANCPAIGSDDLDDLREHNAHTLRRLAGDAAGTRRDTLAASLRRSDSPLAREWGHVLADRQRRAA